MKTIQLKDFTDQQHSWLLKHVGARTHYLVNSIGGVGWVAKKSFEPGMVNTYWNLTFEDERYATFFRLMYPE